MADEIVVAASLIIQSLRYQRAGQFRADMAGAMGPTPGAIAVTTAGVDVDLAQLTQPGVCWLSNLEADGGNFYEYGIYEPATSTFYPLGEVLPGESWLIRLSRNLGEEYVGTGTSAPTNTFRLKATGGTVKALVEAFES